MRLSLLKLLPVLPGRIARKAGERLDRVRIPVLRRLIRYPDPARVLPPGVAQPLVGVATERAIAVKDACAQRAQGPGLHDQQQIAAAWEAIFGRRDDVLRAADRICDHVFDLLGSGETPLGERIPWHSDFKTGYTWPADRPLRKREKVVANQDCDIKVPWELSRFEHLALLGRAYWLSSNERYAREFVDQVSSWIDANPWGCGPNWACTMDVAIRAANWALAWRFFEQSREFDDEARRMIVRSLWEHGVFIEHHLERGRVNGNHYISDLAGLFSIGVFFSLIGGDYWARKACRWREFALDQLCREVRAQVLEDGVDYEKSTSYHRLVLELFTYSFVMAERNGFTLPEDVRHRWERMFEFVAAYTKPDGSAAQVGDADDGMLYKLGTPPVSFLDHRYLLSIGAWIFHRADFAQAAGGFSEEAFWLYGSDGGDCHAGLDPASPASEQSSKAFGTSGFYVIRDGDDWAMIDAGDNGMSGIGAHAHNDTLSFELCVGGRSVIVDPGSYLYTADAEWRNAFRSTAYHNTVMVDGEEIHPINPNWLFALPDAGAVRVTRWEPDSAPVVFEGEHDAYARLREPVTHRRRIEFDPNQRTWTITDSFAGLGRHAFESRLHLAAGLQVGSRQSGVGSREFAVEAGGLTLRIVASSEEEFESAVEDGWYSPSYGVKEPASVLVFRWTGEVPCQFAVKVGV